MKPGPEPFAQWLERSGRSPATVQAYVGATQGLGTDADPGPVIQRAYVALSAGVASGTVQPSTANVRFAAFRSYAAYLGGSGAEVPVALHSFALKPRTVVPLSAEALDRLLDAPVRNGTDPVLLARDAALLAVLVCVPLRVARIASLTRSDMEHLTLSNHARHWIRTYLARRRDTHPALFLRHDRAASGRAYALTPRTIERVVQRYATLAGIHEHLTPERIRAATRTIER